MEFKMKAIRTILYLFVRKKRLWFFSRTKIKFPSKENEISSEGNSVFPRREKMLTLLDIPG